MNLQTVEISYVSDKLVMEHLPRTIYPILREKCHYLFMQCNIFLVSHISKIWQTCKIFVMLYSEPWDNKCKLYRLRNFVETIEIITASFPQIVNYGNDNSFGQLFSLNTIVSILEDKIYIDKFFMIFVNVYIRYKVTKQKILQRQFDF